MSMERWWNGTDRGEQEYWRTNPSQCYFVHYKSRMDCSGIEPGPPECGTVWAERIFFLVLHLMVHIVTIGLQSVKQRRVKPYVVMILKVLLRMPDDDLLQPKHVAVKEITKRCVRRNCVCSCSGGTAARI
jgi:hypothetical protein